MKKSYIFIIITIIGLIMLIADFILKGLKTPVVIKYMRYGSFATILVGLLGWGISSALHLDDKSDVSELSDDESDDELVPK
jgi:hypothetical protein